MYNVLYIYTHNLLTDIETTYADPFLFELGKYNRLAHFLNVYHSVFCICTYSSIHECRVLPNFVDKNIGSLVKFELLTNNG